MNGRETGFQPVFDEKSEVLVLGSFPSVMSRAVGFYYGNPRNAFWRMLGGFFGEQVPDSVEGKRAFVLSKHLALWDVVASCEITGSRDESIRKEEIANVSEIVKSSSIRLILCNGQKAFGLLKKNEPNLLPIAKAMPSTSPRNAGKDVVPAWHKALSEGFFKKGELNGND